jgi:hypothetical protein
MFCVSCDKTFPIDCWYVCIGDILAAAVDTHDGSLDTVDWFRVCFENV